MKFLIAIVISTSLVACKSEYEQCVDAVTDDYLNKIEAKKENRGVSYEEMEVRAKSLASKDCIGAK